MGLNRAVAISCLVAGLTAALASLLAPELGLGIKEAFVFYRLSGIARMPLALAGFMLIFAGVTLAARSWLRIRLGMRDGHLSCLFIGTVAVSLGILEPVLGLGSARSSYLYQVVGARRGLLPVVGLVLLSIGLMPAVRPWIGGQRWNDQWRKNLLGLLRSWTASACLVAVSIVASLGAMEVVLRIAYLADPWALRNFAVNRKGQIVTNIAVQFDPVIGYIAKPFFRSNPSHEGGVSYNHGEYGIRLNRPPTEPESADVNSIRQGGILAVGDSFVFGSEVRDDESWPAYLESLVGFPVVNGAAGGYGIDQAYLRIEQLLPLVQPRVIILGCIPNCNQRNEMSMNGGLSKAHFEIVDDQLVLYPPELPSQQVPQRVGMLRTILDHLYSVYWVVERLDLSNYRYTKQNGEEISCRLMEKLAALAKRHDAKAMFAVEYSGYQVIGQAAGREIWKVRDVIGCAHRHGVTVVDSFQFLLAEYKSDPQGFWDNWVKQPTDKHGHSGHMSAKGNRLMAKLIASGIADTTTEPFRPPSARSIEAR